MSILIAYYSRRGENYVNGDIVNLPVGNTEVAARMIQKLAGGETFRIDTVKDWWSTMPMAVYSFLEKYDLSGKTILPFCTHEGSGLGHSVSDIKKICPGTTVLKGLAIQGGSVHRAEGEISAWLKATGMIK